MKEHEKLPCGCFYDGVYWNQFNKAVQCHRCGAVYSYKEMECAALTAKLREAEERIRALEDEQLCFYKWVCRIKVDGRTTERLWNDYQAARPYVIDELKSNQPTSQGCGEM